MTLLCALSRLSAQTNVSIAPPPDWVRPIEWKADTARPANSKSEGTRYLLDERQENPQRQEEFVRVLNLMENETGVQDSGSLSFYFDPSYQELILHQVQIHRGGQVLNRLERSKIKTIQPEPALDGHMLTGGQSALLFVEDLRVGDVLEYFYTTRGYNPVLGGHYSPRFGVQFGTTVDRQRIRVLWSSDKPLHVRTHLTDASPAKKIGGGVTEYTWDFTNLTAIEFEDSLPAGFEPYPYVELSDFKDWARVVDWALPLYAITNANLPPELQQLIVHWQNTGASDEERTRLALEFVQDELRYTGLELGPDSYRPTPPFETFQKRFGDCKGKALLLCTIFRAMNFEVWPALVNTLKREAIADRLPSPFAFNHVIVKLRLGGKIFWLDPTASHQGGALADRFHSRFGKALVIQAGVTVLEDVPSLPAENTRQHVSSIFQIRDYKSPATLTVQTTYRGWAWWWTWPKGPPDYASMPPLLESERRLDGLGGWLILVGLGLCLGPFLRVGLLLKSWEGYFSIHVWQAYALPQTDQYHPLFAPLLVAELLFNIALVGLNVLALAMFFAKRKTFPKIYILFLCLNAAFLITDDLISRQLPFLADRHSATVPVGTRSAFVAILWSAYMLKSRRVKFTFVR